MAELYREQLWNDLLTAEMNVRYYGYLVARYERYEKGLKWFLAAFSAGPVAGWAIWKDIPEMWAVLSAIVLLLAIGSPILDFPAKVSLFSKLYGQWIGIEAQHTMAWLKAQEEPARDLSVNLSELRGKLVVVRAQEAGVPRDKKLILKCQAEVLKRRGLEGG